MKKILILGATGFIGRNAAEYFAEKLDLINNPDIKVLNTQRELLALDLKRRRYERMPKLAAFYQITASAYQLEFKYNDAQWLDAQNLGISLSVPIFSSGMQGAKIKQEFFLNLVILTNFFCLLYILVPKC